MKGSTPVLALAARISMVLMLLGGCGLPKPPTDTKSARKLEPLYPVGEFHLVDHLGRNVSQADFEDKAWVAAFIFTRCSGPCPRVSGLMAELQHRTTDMDDVRLVTITVDPDHDTPAVLAKYGQKYQADPSRWLFLTGKADEVYRLIRDGFKLTAEPNKGKDRTPGNEVLHDPRVAIVDRHGNVCEYVNGLESKAVDKVMDHLHTLRGY